MDNLPAYLAANITKLRALKGFSQAQLAELAAIPRSTLTNIESGAGNPSLNNLVRVSAALGVGIEELLSKPRSESILIPAAQVPTQSRGHGRVKMHKLLPDKIKGIELDKIVLAGDAVMGGHPHLDGTKEYLTVTQGEFLIHVGRERFNVKEGDVLAFPGNQPHSYRNARKTESIAVSMVIPVPVFL